MKTQTKLGLFLLFASSGMSANLFAEKITVTSGADSGAGSLREAIANANANDTIVFADNVKTVTLNIYSINIEKNITIIGNENNNTVIIFTNANSGRHFYIPENAGITATLNNLTLKDGYATQCGGAIFNRKTNTLTLNNCIFVNNRADNTNGAVDNSGKLTINNCVFENNSVTSDGAGAVYNSGEMFIYNSIFTNNIGTFTGAVYNSGTITIMDCIFKENKGGIASAFWNRGPAVVVNSLFTLNEHISAGSTLYDRSGTISNWDYGNSPNMTVVNSTIVNNTGEVGLYNSGQATLHNNIIWNNSTNDVYTNTVEIKLYGTVIAPVGTTTASHNLTGTNNTDLSGNGNLIGVNPLFAGDGDYSLQENSPAINAGNNSFLSAELTTDLAGNPRISGGVVDMGAYEYQFEEPQIGCEEHVALLRDSISTLQNENTTLQDSINKLHYQLITCSTERNALNDSVSALNGLIAALLNNISSLQGQNTTLQDSIAKLLQLLTACENGGTSNTQIIPTNQIQIYPNPVNDELRIANYEWQQGDVVEMFDMLGKRVYSERTNGNNLTIDMSPYQQGNYILRIGNRVAKIVKQ